MNSGTTFSIILLVTVMAGCGKQADVAPKPASSLPDSQAISNIEFRYWFNTNYFGTIDGNRFRDYLKSAKPIANVNESQLPWTAGSFRFNNNIYFFTLYSGGLGQLSLPDGRSIRILSRPEKMSHSNDATNYG